MDTFPPPPPPPASLPKPDRKTVEKKRRNEMKFLYSKLDSLITSSSSSSSGQQLPDRLDEATNYIKKVQGRVEQLKEQKRQLTGSSKGTSKERKAPQIEIHDLGSSLKAVLIISSDDHRAIMHKAIRAVEEGGAEVLNAHFSSVGDKCIVSLHTSVRGNNESNSGTGSMLDRLKRAF